MMLEDNVADMLPLVKFTAEDRCDRCGAQALAMAHRDDKELLFCGHHRKKHFHSLIENDWTVIDDYEQWEKIASEDLTTVDAD